MFICFVDPPLVVITPSLISVSEGEEVSLLCEAEGVGPLNIKWEIVANESSLPAGVQQNGNELSIAAAARSHAGTYVCSVSNLAGVTQHNVTLNIYSKYYPMV